MHRTLTYLLCALAFAACTPEDPEVIDFSDIVPESENYQEGEVNADNAAVYDSLLPVKQRFNAGGIEVGDLIVFEDHMFPDRFGPNSSERYQLTNNEDTVRYYSWRYDDSLKVMNALYNWLDCFGPDCKSVQLGAEVNLQRAPLKIMVSDTTLIFIEGVDNIDYVKWDEYHENCGYKKEWNLIIEQGRRQKARWYTYENEEKIRYKE